jgi:acetate kinase
MGLTPLEGVIMGTRCGTVDPGAILALMEKENLDAAGLNNLLNKQSGMQGISGVSSDCRDIEETMAVNDSSRLTFEVLCYDILKFIGSYAAALDGVDAVTFTAGIGENSPEVREWVCDRLQNLLGIKVNKEANTARSKEDRIISAPGSRTAVCIVPTNEDLMIARYTAKLVFR